jgi:hypothetical protein
VSGFVWEVRITYIYRFSPVSFWTWEKVSPLNSRYSLSSPIKTVLYMYVYVQFFRKYAVSHISCPAARLIHRTESLHLPRYAVSAAAMSVTVKQSVHNSLCYRRPFSFESSPTFWHC